MFYVPGYLEFFLSKIIQYLFNVEHQKGRNIEVSFRNTVFMILTFVIFDHSILKILCINLYNTTFKTELLYYL